MVVKFSLEVRHLFLTTDPHNAAPSRLFFRQIPHRLTMSQHHRRQASKVWNFNSDRRCPTALEHNIFRTRCIDHGRKQPLNYAFRDQLHPVLERWLSLTRISLVALHDQATELGRTKRNVQAKLLEI